MIEYIAVQSLSYVCLFVTPWTASDQTLLSSIISGSFSHSCLLSQWCSLTISYSALPFSFSLQTFPVSGSFPKSKLFASGGQSTGASASALALPKSVQGWFPLRLTGLMSLLCMGRSRVNPGFWVPPEDKNVRELILFSRSSLVWWTGFAFDKIFDSKQTIESPRSVDIHAPCQSQDLAAAPSSKKELKHL